MEVLFEKQFKVRPRRLSTATSSTFRMLPREDSISRTKHDSSPIKASPMGDMSFQGDRNARNSIEIDRIQCKFVTQLHRSTYMLMAYVSLAKGDSRYAQDMDRDCTRSNDDRGFRTRSTTSCRRCAWSRRNSTGAGRRRSSRPGRRSSGTGRYTAWPGSYSAGRRRSRKPRSSWRRRPRHYCRPSGRNSARCCYRGRDF